ncbi:hypothetical protein DID88_002079 [Monilinia fructigena]|uniref:Mitochondrial phosphate carrier protein n=1 Tax=Monilinia fructigena TaxID=38457 RepID=A0A395IVZ0_9HELO|nr:hypothetical protein DID88_002079 [Monilinia fructigena]
MWAWWNNRLRSNSHSRNPPRPREMPAPSRLQNSTPPTSVPGLKSTAPKDSGVYSSYGFYEAFKYLYGEKLFPNANQTVVFLGASASAEFLADMALCPFEAIKVRMQTTLPPFANSLREGLGKVIKEEGYGGLYKGLYPLWGRQIPYTMTGVSFLGGYIAGIGCAVVSHPADVMVSKLNSDRKAGESAGKATTRIYGNIGFKGLWNGLPVRIVMIGTLTAFQWLIYDSFKVGLGLPTTGGH